MKTTLDTSEIVCNNKFSLDLYEAKLLFWKLSSILKWVMINDTTENISQAKIFILT